MVAPRHKRRPLPTARITAKSPVERLTGVADQETVELFSTTFGEYEPIGRELARETLGAVR